MVIMAVYSLDRRYSFSGCQAEIEKHKSQPSLYRLVGFAGAGKSHSGARELKTFDAFCSGLARIVRRAGGGNEPLAYKIHESSIPMTLAYGRCLACCRRQSCCKVIHVE